MDDDKPILWVGTTLDDVSAFPDDVKQVMGFALRIAQRGGKHPRAKPLKGHKGAGVLEIVDDFDGDTYRAVYTVKFPDAVYGLHAFQKKSKRGRETTKTDLKMIETRLRTAEEDYKARNRLRTNNG